MSDDSTAELMARAVQAQEQEQCAASYAEAVRRHRADRRERIATAALQGLLACLGSAGGPFKVLSARAVEYADMLIEELDKGDGR